MRDPIRLFKIYDTIFDYHKQKPDLRFLQLMNNFFTWHEVRHGGDGFYREDDEFIGTITSISDRNILVELDNTMVEGVVRTNSLECPFVYEMERYSLVDPTNSNNFYRLGDRVRVRISKISKEDKTIEFTIVQKIKDEQTGNKGYMFCKKKS